MLWNMLFGLCILGLVKFGDYISDDCPQAGYACPKICDVDHKHYPRKECRNAKTRKEDEENSQEVSKEDWAKNEEEVLIRGYRDAKTEQESRSDSTTVQSFQ